MKFSTAILTNVLLATAAVATPWGREQRRALREGRISKPLIRTSTAAVEGVNSSHIEFSSNWAGAVIESPPSGQKWTSVTGTFVVPTDVTSPSGGSAAASAWVGIDGDTAGNSILQTGIDFTVSGGRVTYDAWYEWFPDFAHDFTGITIAGGNRIRLTVTASSSKAGTALIENLTNGQSVSKSLTSTVALAQQNAEWIVEDFEEGNSLVPFADFDQVVFSAATAKTASQSLTPSGATIIEIESSSGRVLTDVSASSSGVTVTYV